MPVWTFLDYIEPGGRNPIADWSSRLPDDAQAAIDARLLQMEGLRHWSDKWVSGYRGLKGIFEVRIPFNRVQYRPMGMYSPHVRMAFVLLCGTIEKGGKIPRSDLETVSRRRLEVMKDPRRAKPHQF